MGMKVTPVFSSDVPCLMLRFCPSLSLHGCAPAHGRSLQSQCPHAPPSPFPNPCWTEERSETRLPPSLSPSRA